VVSSAGFNSSLLVPVSTGKKIVKKEERYFHISGILIARLFGSKLQRSKFSFIC